MNRKDLIRQWWYLYAIVLRSGRINREFLEHDKAVADAEITREGRSMPRDGAEDLADICDEIRRKSCSVG